MITGRSGGRKQLEHDNDGELQAIPSLLPSFPSGSLSLSRNLFVNPLLQYFSAFIFVVGDKCC
jgi:hypothetical protein